MPLPGALARFNRRVTNPLMRTIAGRAPLLGVVVHKGRRSGTTYRTPVNVFVDDGDYVFALTYGADRDWVRNVLAAGEFELEHRGRTVALTEPRLVGKEEATSIPRPIRGILRALRVTQFLRMRAASSG